MKKNKFQSTKKNFHLADNDNLDKNDKYAKVRPFYDLVNESLKQFGYWHNDYSIDEQMILWDAFSEANHESEKCKIWIQEFRVSRIRWISVS